MARPHPQNPDLFNRLESYEQASCPVMRRKFRLVPCGECARGAWEGMPLEASDRKRTVGKCSTHALTPQAPLLIGPTHWSGWCHKRIRAALLRTCILISDLLKNSPYSPETFSHQGGRGATPFKNEAAQAGNHERPLLPTRAPIFLLRMNTPELNYEKLEQAVVRGLIYV